MSDTSLTMHVMVGCPACTKVMLVAKAANLPVVYKFYRSATDLQTKEFKSMSPLGVCPVLETSEGVLLDASPISRYLADLKKSLNLNGQSLFDRAQVDMWCEVTASVVCSKNCQERFSGSKSFDESTLECMSKSQCSVLQRVEEHLALRTYFVGNSVTVADLSFLGAVSAFRSCSLADSKSYPNLARWYSHMTQASFYKNLFGNTFANTKTFTAPSEEACKTFQEAEAAKKPAQGKPQGKAANKKQEKKPAPAPKKKEEPKKVEDAEKKPAKPEVSEEELEAGKWFYDWKTLFANAKDKTEACDQMIKNMKPHLFSVWSCHYDKMPKEGKDLTKTCNQLAYFMDGFGGFNRDTLGVIGIYGKPEDHDIKGVWVWKGTDMHMKVKDHNSTEYYQWKKMDITKKEDQDKLRTYWCNLAEEKSVVEGQQLLSVKVFK